MSGMPGTGTPTSPEPRGISIFLDADACPVKEESYKVARRYSIRVMVVANASLRVPLDALVELVVQPGFGAADDWIAAQVRENDIVVTADIPLAARCVEGRAIVIDPKGRLLTDGNVGAALATRNLMEELRQYGPQSGGPAPMTSKDRSRFLSTLDMAINAARRGRAVR